MGLTVRKINTHDITCIALFTALFAACSWIAIPTPTRIDFTLQILALFLILGTLGGKRGTMSVIAYLLLGAIGVPVFAGFYGGISAFLTPSGGFLIGYIFTALLMWGIETFFGSKPWILGLSMLLGLAVCYAFGTVWFMIVYPMGGESVSLVTALAWCVVPYVPFDLIKIAAAWTLSLRFRRYVK